MIPLRQILRQIGQQRRAFKGGQRLAGLLCLLPDQFLAALQAPEPDEGILVPVHPHGLAQLGRVAGHVQHVVPDLEGQAHPVGVTLGGPQGGRLDGEQAAELGSGEHPIFIALPNGFPAFTMNVGVVAVYEDCVSEMEQVDIFYDDVIENEANVALYPNPTKGNVTIEAAGMSRITVVSMLGQVVFDTELDANTYTLNMSQFNAGMYMVRVYTENGVAIKRVTVMQ